MDFVKVVHQQICSLWVCLYVINYYGLQLPPYSVSWKRTVTFLDLLWGFIGMHTQHYFSKCLFNTKPDSLDFLCMAKWVLLWFQPVPLVWNLKWKGGRKGLHWFVWTNGCSIVCRHMHIIWIWPLSWTTVVIFCSLDLNNNVWKLQKDCSCCPISNILTWFLKVISILQLFLLRVQLSLEWKPPCGSKELNLGGFS